MNDLQGARNETTESQVKSSVGLLQTLLQFLDVGALS